MSSAKKRAYTSAVREQKADETRRRILDAAKRLFLERGFDATTVEAVAEELQRSRRDVPPRLDSDRYKGIQWTGVDDVVRGAFREAETHK